MISWVIAVDCGGDGLVGLGLRWGLLEAQLLGRVFWGRICDCSVIDDRRLCSVIDDRRLWYCDGPLRTGRLIDTYGAQRRDPVGRIKKVQWLKCSSKRVWIPM